jgi:hypothetical protein
LKISQRKGKILLKDVTHLTKEQRRGTHKKKTHFDHFSQSVAAQAVSFEPQGET